MLLPLELPLSNDTLTFQLYDEDKLGDDIICSLKFSIKDLLKNDTPRDPKLADTEQKLKYTMKWVNLYGCNKEFTGGFMDGSNSE